MQTTPTELIDTPSTFHQRMLADDKRLLDQEVPVYLRRFYVSALHNCLDFVPNREEANIEGQVPTASTLFSTISQWYRMHYPFEWLNVPLASLLIWDEQSDVLLRPIIGVEGQAILPIEHLGRTDVRHLLEGGCLRGYQKSIEGLIYLRQMPSRNMLMELAIFNFQQGQSALMAPIPDYADARWQFQQALEKILKTVLVSEGLSLEQIRQRASHNIVTFFFNKPTTLVQLVGQTGLHFSEGTVTLCEKIECSPNVRYGEKHTQYADKDDMSKAAAHAAYHAFLHFIADNAITIKVCLNKTASEDSQIRRSAEYQLMWPVLIKDYSVQVLGANHYVGKPLSLPLGIE